MERHNPRFYSGSTYTFHFKDIKIENLGDIVEKPDILEIGTDAATCWSEGDDLLITSSSHSQNGYVERTITSIDVDAGEITLGSGINPLDNSLLSLADGEDGRKFAVEVASLSRQVKFVAEKDDTDELHGGHLIVYHTPLIPQLLRGVEISNFGQQGEYHLF